MPEDRRKANLTPWMIAALAACAWGVIAVAFASLAPSSIIPHVFYSYHVEHFAAFYILSFVAAAGLARVNLTRLSLGLIVFAVVLEVIRMLTPQHRLTSAEDLVCDIAGVLAAYAPILLSRFRDSMANTPAER
jgi:hypothetical protein